MNYGVKLTKKEYKADGKVKDTVVVEKDRPA